MADTLQEAVKPFVEYTENMAHYVLALLLDPRFCHCVIDKFEAVTKTLQVSSDQEYGRKLALKYVDLLMRLSETIESARFTCPDQTPKSGWDSLLPFSYSNITPATQEFYELVKVRAPPKTDVFAWWEKHSANRVRASFQCGRGRNETS